MASTPFRNHRYLSVMSATLHAYRKPYSEAERGYESPIFFLPKCFHYRYSPLYFTYVVSR